MFQLTWSRYVVLFILAVACSIPLSVLAAEPSADGRSLDPDTRFAIRTPDQGAVDQLQQLFRAHQYKDAFVLFNTLAQPQAVWLTGGTPTEVAANVDTSLREAAAQRARAVFVIYNIPGRDCGGFSAGGAQTTPDYEAWIDAIATAVGDRRAIIILEPDGLANLPSDCGLDPTGQLTTDRFTQLSYAVNALESLPGTRVYLDAGNSHWQAVGTIASRLVRAGLDRTQGFSLNVSNYQPTEALIQYGTWIGQCISFANDSSQGGWRLGHYDFCASQYFPANADDFSTWHLTDEWYAQNLSAPPTNPPHFVLDTSRNGQTHATNATTDVTYPTESPGRMTQYSLTPFNQGPNVITALAGGSWCNPPGAGVGARPTIQTGSPLVDAFLWIKTVGESDGSCDAAGGARAWDYNVYSKPGWPTTAADQALFDPLWGLKDPPAGAWFPAQALQLGQLAVPPLSTAPLLPR
ncbi:MAG TPA: glycoside hydrolase family 6 protein [Steroidobacteraceae bacterium]